MKIGVSNCAINDLETIIDYYAREGVPDIGRQFAEDIIERIQVLSDHPDMGRVVP
jgi:toxin ParE1/3/4